MTSDTAFWHEHLPSLVVDQDCLNEVSLTEVIVGNFHPTIDWKNKYNRSYR